LRSLTGCNATGASTCADFGPALGCAIECGRKPHPRNPKRISGPDLSPNTQSLDLNFGVPNANGSALRAKHSSSSLWITKLHKEKDGTCNADEAPTFRPPGMPSLEERGAVNPAPFA
jgi:hypothetical protein